MANFYYYREPPPDYADLYTFVGDVENTIIIMSAGSVQSTFLSGFLSNLMTFGPGPTPIDAVQHFGLDFGLQNIDFAVYPSSSGKNPTEEFSFFGFSFDEQPSKITIIRNIFASLHEISNAHKKKPKPVQKKRRMARPHLEEKRAITARKPLKSALKLPVEEKVQQASWVKAAKEIQPEKPSYELIAEEEIPEIIAL